MRCEAAEFSAALAPASREVKMHVIVFVTGEVMVVQVDSGLLREDGCLSSEFLRWVQQNYGDIASALRADSILSCRQAR